MNDDPYVNRWDLGADPCQFGKDRIALATELMKDLDAPRRPGRRFMGANSPCLQRTAQPVGRRQRPWLRSTSGASRSRAITRPTKTRHDPIVPVAGAKQRECLKFLTEAILSDKSFQFSPALLRRLGTERWSHWGTDGFYGPGVDISVLERILGIQKIVLGQCLSSSTLARLENQQLQAEPNANPLSMDEVFRSLTDGIWSDLDHLPLATDDKGGKFVLSTIRRNLQREYLRRFSGMVIGNGRGVNGDSYSYMVVLEGWK